jgi:2-keto-4-pentenoate hydratase/2-oxohepta-3-ene-1,7-dioic acid hydratase in catechol pathway
MTAFLDQSGWRGVIDQLARASGARVDASTVRLGPPVPNPRKLMLAGVNTFSHLAEVLPLVGTVEPPRKPVILSKATSSVTGPHDPILLPPETKKLDYEVELGIVIGKRARRISADQVREHLAGFVTLNDVSARDLQLADHEEQKFYRVHYLGKSCDTFCPIGPALVTADEVDWERPLRMRALVNGQMRQDSDTADLCHGISSLVTACSEAMTLYPGDIIASGSPAGVALFREPLKFLQDGDIVRCEIDGIGAIENRVTTELLHV